MSGDDAHGTFSGRSVGGGRYVLRSLLGEGGMASVHLAHDTVLDRPVAVKTLHSDLGREASFRERFRREAQAVAKLNHTNIVSVFDSGEDTIDGAVVPYIVMEYVEGKPLRQVLDEDVAQYGAMPTEKALKIAGDVLAALAESHSMGLVHRDIKPGNVMLTRRGVVKVMDFGIARAMQSGVTSMTQTGMVVGTPQYLSPEQALGRGVDERSDLYSVGCMLFELLTGRLPFDGDSPLAIAYQHVQQTPPAPSEFNRSVPPSVDALVARSLRKNPAERFPTADAMRDESDRVAASLRGSGALPHITGAGQDRGRGEGVASAVFPPVEAPLGTPPPQVRTPYQPPYQQGTFGPSTPPPTPVPAAYGYPQQPPQQHHQAPPPQYGTPASPAGGGHPGGPHRPGGPGSGGPGGGRRRSPAGIAVGAVAAVAVIGLIVVIAVKLGGSGSPDPNPTASKSTSASTGPTSHPSATQSQAQTQSAGPQPSISQGDPTRTVDSTECTQLTKGFEDSGKYIMPDLTFKYVTSVKTCMKDGGWKYKIKYQDEDEWGKGTVLATNPKPYDEFYPTGSKQTTVTITVSTGKIT
jgi:serine/threonine protein kinase